MWESLDNSVDKGFFKKERVDENVCIFSKDQYYPQKYWLSTELYGSVQDYAGVIQWGSGVFL